MRNTIRVAMMAAAMIFAGATAVRAQLVDPSTGITVNAADDPTDFSAIASGQAGNAGMEANAAAMESMNAMMAQQQAQQAAQSAQNFQDFMNQSSSQSDTAETAEQFPSFQPPPGTPKPTIGPSSGKLTAGTLITIQDTDRNAVLYYTTDGTKPTGASPRYTTPISVTAKTKVSAMAFDINDTPSAVVTKSFKVKD
jgi:type II secretory pathway pseudopilin PulG